MPKRVIVDCRTGDVREEEISEAALAKAREQGRSLVVGVACPTDAVAPDVADTEEG